MKKFFNLIDKKFKPEIFIFVFLILFQITFESVGIALIPIFLSFVLNPDLISGVSNEWLKSILLSAPHEKLTFYLTLSLIGVFFLKSLYTIFLLNFQSSLISKINLNIKDFFFRNYLKTKYLFINQYNSSDILRNVDEETSKYTSNFFLMLTFFKDMILALIIFAILIYVDYLSSIIAITLMLGISIIYLLFWKRKLTNIGEVLLTSKKQTIQWIIQSLSMIKEIIITNKSDKAANKFLNNAFLYEEGKKRLRVIQGVPGPIFELIIVSFILSTALIFIKYESENTIPILSLYVIAAVRLLPIFSRFSSYLVSIRSVLPTIRLLENERKKINDINNKNTSTFEKNESTKINFNKSIFLRDLSFKYYKNDFLTINKINLEIMKNSCVAFVGKSGSGKTTLINIIAGLLDPTEGEILIDGKSIKNSLNSWQKKIGLLSQENYLIDDTIKNNITLLYDENSINKNKLNEAILYSGVEEILEKLPDKLETKVGEKGTFLSSGQIQRIALARLLYQDPEVMIFDEFTNSLDHENEDIILKNLDSLRKKKDKTMIIISHKMKPLKISDKIFIINNSKIDKTLDYQKFYEDFSAVYE